MLLLLATLVASFLISTNQDDRYESTAQVLLADSAAQRTLDPGSQNTFFLTRELSNEISLASSDVVAGEVAQRIGELPEIDIEAESAADIISFVAEAPTADQAATIANTWAEVYVEVKQNEAVASVVAAAERLQERLEELRTERQELRQPLDSLQDRIAATQDEEQAAQLQTQYNRLAEDLSYELDLLTAQSEATVASLADLELQAEVAAVGEARIVQVAAPPTSPANPPLSRNLVLGAVVGLILGVGMALLMDMRDNTIKSSADVQALGLAVLAAIPEASKRAEAHLARITQADPEGMYADAFQKLRAAIEFVSVSSQIKTVLITSPNPSEGKSTTASNLAIALSSVGRTAALVDVDFRRSRVHNIYRISRSPGLADHIVGHVELGQIAHRAEGANGLFVVPTGTVPPNPAAFVGLPAFTSAVNSIATRVDTVVLDAPPLLAVSDTYSMAHNVDGVVLTVRAGETTRSELTEVLTLLAQVDANVLGVVMIGVKEAEAYGGRYYTREHADQPPSSANGGIGRASTRRQPSGQIQAADDLAIVYNSNRISTPGRPPAPATNGSEEMGQRVNGQHNTHDGVHQNGQHGNGQHLNGGHQQNGQRVNGQHENGQLNGHQQNGHQQNGQLNGQHMNGHQQNGRADNELATIFPEMFDQ